MLSDLDKITYDKMQTEDLKSLFQRSMTNQYSRKLRPDTIIKYQLEKLAHDF